MARSVYATIADLRTAGLTDETQFPDTTLTGLLELASEIVDSVTGQVFGPFRTTYREDGETGRTVSSPGRNKIIEIEQIQVLRYGLDRALGFTGGTPDFLTEDDYSVHDRMIRLRPADKGSSRFERAFRDVREIRFPNDDKIVEVTGVFGWLALETKFETTLAGDLASGATAIKLQDTGDLEPNDLLLVDGRFWVIVLEITTESDVGPPVVTGIASIDPAPKSAASGAPVVRYGKVPLLVRQATIRTALAQQFQAGSEDEEDRLAAGRIRREQTDAYEIEFFQAPGSARVNSGTGDPVADAWLSRFRAPVITATWV